MRNRLSYKLFLFQIHPVVGLVVKDFLKEIEENTLEKRLLIDLFFK